MDHQGRSRIRRGLRRALLAVLALLLASSVPLLTPLPAQADESTKVLLVLDVSGSMNEPISSGGTKFAAAKRALKRGGRRDAGRHPGRAAGLRVEDRRAQGAQPQGLHRHRAGAADRPAGPAQDVPRGRLVHRQGRDARSPTHWRSRSTTSATAGKRVLILISDGEETCAGDPCPTARKLAKAGVDLQFNAIGLAVNAKARKQLQCIAKAGDGNYYDADNTVGPGGRAPPDHPARAASVPDHRYAGRGHRRPGEGSADRSRSVQGHATTRATTPRYYRITRTPGSTVTASIATIVRPYPTQNTENWTLTLATGDGTPCATSQATSGGLPGRHGARRGGLLQPGQPGHPTARLRIGAATDPSCCCRWHAARRSATTTTCRSRCVLAEEPPITNLAELPEPVTPATTARPVPFVQAGTAPARSWAGPRSPTPPRSPPAAWRDSMADRRDRLLPASGWSRGSGCG